MRHITAGGERMLLALGMALLVVSCSTTPKASSPGLEDTRPQAGVFTLLFASSREVELEPCGCSIRPLGGVDHEWNWLETVKKGKHGKILSFSAGTTFVTLPFQADLADYLAVKSGFMVDALNHLGTSGLSPSVEDFRLGAKKLTELKAQSRFPWISANLVDPKNGAPFFERYHVYPETGGSVVVIGLSRAAEVSGVKVLPPEEALRTTIGALPAEPGKGPRLLVVLSDLPVSERQRLVPLFPQVNFWAGGVKDDESRDADAYGPGTRVFNPPSRGRTITRLDVYPVAGKWGAKDSSLALFNREEADAVTNLRDQKSQALTSIQTALKKKHVKKPERATLVAEEERLSQYLARTEKVLLDDSNANATFDFTVADLDSSFAEPKNALSELVERFKRAVHDQAVASDAQSK